MLVPTIIEYSHSWIEGPKRGFISSGKSFISIGVNLEAFLNSSEVLNPKVSGSEVFGEIKVKEEKTGLLLKVIPITLIHDTPLKSKKEWNLQLRAEEGKKGFTFTFLLL